MSIDLDHIGLPVAPLRSLREHLPRARGRKTQRALCCFPPPFSGEVPSTECEAEGDGR
jgi:hypothetical protein